METGPTQKSLTTLGLMALVILAPASVFAITGDAPQTLALAAGGLVLSAAWRKPLARNTRSFVYTGLLALVAAVLSEQAMPIDPKRFFMLVPVHVYCPPLIFLAVALTFLDQRDSNIAGVVGLAVLAMMMAGNCWDFQVPHKRLPVPAEAERYLHLIYGSGVAVQLCAAIALMARAPYVNRHLRASPQRRAGRFALTTGLVVLTAVGTLLMRRCAGPLQSLWQAGFTSLLRGGRLGQPRGAVFGRDVDLWRTVPHLSAADNAVVLRALAAAPPGYLRGRAYTLYRNGKWTTAAAEVGLPFEQPGGRLTYSIFKRPQPPGEPAGPAEVSRLDLYPARDFRSDVLLAPGTASAFEVLADALNHSDDGDLTPVEWEPRVGYTAVSTRPSGDGAYFGPLDPASEAYRSVPDTVRAPLAALSAAIFAPGAAEPGRDLSALEHFFQGDFRYALGTAARPRDEDPVLAFLQRRTGHCELFASAAVLLLRSRGIPARYVTGVVCQENLSAGLWLARLADVHAWAEAYDATQGRWLLVEMTPASGIPQGQDRSHLLDRGLEHLGFTWQHVIALLRRGNAAEAIAAGAKGLLRGLGWLLLNPVGAPLAALALGLALWHWHRRPGRGARTVDLPAARNRLQRLYLDTLRALRRRLPAVPPQPTPRSLAALIRSHLPPEPAPELALALERYEILRYGRRVPAEEDIAALEKQFRLGLRQVRKTALSDPA